MNKKLSKPCRKFAKGTKYIEQMIEQPAIFFQQKMLSSFFSLCVFTMKTAPIDQVVFSRPADVHIGNFHH